MVEFQDEFWAYLDRLVASSQIVIDRPKGSHHPKFPELVYPLDYGYLKGTTTVDGGGLDLWIGSAGVDTLVALALTVDLVKRDTEVKLLLGCSETDFQAILGFLNGHSMRAILVKRPGDH